MGGEKKYKGSKEVGQEMAKVITADSDNINWGCFGVSIRWPCPWPLQPVVPHENNQPSLLFRAHRGGTVGRTRWVGRWVERNTWGGQIEHPVLPWWCLWQAWQHQALPDLLLLTGTSAEGSPLPPAWRHLPKMASAKLTEAVALFHWHSFIRIRGFARIISLARGGWLFLYASTQHMCAGKSIQSHFTACLVPEKELTPSNSLSSRAGNEIKLPTFLHKNTRWN